MPTTFKISLINLHKSKFSIENRSINNLYNPYRYPCCQLLRFKDDIICTATFKVRMADSEDTSTHKKSKRKSKAQKDPKSSGDQGGSIKSVESPSSLEAPKTEVPVVSKQIEKVEIKGDQNVNNIQTKSREEILAEREAKKLAKQALKMKAQEAQAVKKGNLPQGKSNETSQMQDKENILQKDSSAKPKEVTFEVIKDVEDKGPENKTPCGKDKNEGKSKAQLRAERRAIQEAQRAKKLEKAKEVTEEKNITVTEVPVTVKVSKVIKPPVSEDKMHKVKLFAHLYRPDFDCVEM